jgi:hypothetical protein
MGHQPGQQYWKRLSKRTLAVAASASSQDVSNLLWGMGSLQYMPSSPWLDQLLRQHQHKLQDCCPEALASLMLSLVTLGHKPSSSWMDSCCQRMQQLLPVCRPQALASFVGALASLAVPVQPALQEQLQCCASRLLPEMNAKDLAHTLQGLVQLQDRQQGQGQGLEQQPASSQQQQGRAAGQAGQLDDALLTGFLQQMRQQVATAGIQDVSRVLWACAKQSKR